LQQPALRLQQPALRLQQPALRLQQPALRLQQVAQCCGGRRTPGVRACARVRATGGRPTFVGNETASGWNAPEWDAPKRERAPQWERAFERPCCAAAAMRAPSLPSAAQACA
jgi:hypothetical protein